MDKEKIIFKGSHPDSLYRVPTTSGGSAIRALRVLRMLRWPLALVLICLVLALFVYFLIPYKSMMFMNEDLINATDWESNRLVTSFSDQQQTVLPTKAPVTNLHLNTPGKVTGYKTSEIDFYESDNNKKNNEVTIVQNIPKVLSTSKWPLKPVFPDHIKPEVQYGADEHTLRNPKLLEDLNAFNSNDKAVKLHITLSPEMPSTVVPHITLTPEIPAKQLPLTTLNPEKFSYPLLTKVVPYLTNSSFNTRLGNETGHNSYWLTKQWPNKNEKRSDNSHSSKTTNIPEPEIVIPSTEKHSEQSKPISQNVNEKFTSGHSKIFGIGIEDAASMQPTTQSSVHNTRVSPTLPTWRDRDDTTTKKYPTTYSDVSQCRSTRLHLCRGVLPYDLSSSPALLNGIDITSFLPQIEYLVTTDCSNRLRQFFCALLEPECSPPPHPPKLPCYNLCQAIKDSCDEFIPQEIVAAFNCREYPRDNCIAAQSPCTSNEFKCGNGTCILKDWVCDGTLDCPTGEDEETCSTCAKNEFSCESGGCIARQWLCDGYRDCPAGEDELNATCNAQPQTGRVEPGEDAVGSAPAPSVRRPNRLADHRKVVDDRKIEETDSSKELLMTSDSNNGLKRNFMRRPSPARLSPYTPKLRQFPKMDLSTQETVIKTTDTEPQTTTIEAVTTELAEEHQQNKLVIPIAEIIMKTNFTENSESNTDYVRSYTSHSSPCPSGELRCVDGRCITFTQLCDGVVDCSDKADENNCYT